MVENKLLNRHVANPTWMSKFYVTVEVPGSALLKNAAFSVYQFNLRYPILRLQCAAAIIESLFPRHGRRNWGDWRIMNGSRIVGHEILSTAIRHSDFPMSAIYCRCLGENRPAHIRIVVRAWRNNLWWRFFDIGQRTRPPPKRWVIFALLAGDRIECRAQSGGNTTSYRTYPQYVIQFPDQFELVELKISVDPDIFLGGWISALTHELAFKLSLPYINSLV